MKKKMLAILVALVLCIGLLPMNVFATEGEPACTCTALCAEGGVNAECPVCSTDYTQCAYVAPPVCNCAALCAEGSVNAECPVCSTDDTQCAYVAPIVPDPVASVTVGETVTEYENLDEAITAWSTDGGTLKLLKDCETAKYNNYLNANSTLDLNGKTLTVTKTTSAFLKPEQNIVLTINGNGGLLKTTGASFVDNTSATGAKLVVNDATLTNTHTSKKILLRLETIELTGCTINAVKTYKSTNGTAGSINVTGSATIADTTITTTTSGGGVLIYSKGKNSTVTISGASNLNAAGDTLISTDGKATLDSGNFAGNVCLNNPYAIVEVKTDITVDVSVGASFSVLAYDVDSAETGAFKTYSLVLNETARAVALVKPNGDIYNYVSWKNAYSSQEDGDKIVLYVDLSDFSQKVLGDVTLDLNGHTISGSGQYVFLASNSGHLTITDSSEIKDASGNIITPGTGRIKNTATSGDAIAVYVYNGGALTVEAGTLASHKTDEHGRAIFANGSSATIEINGGTLEAGQGVYLGENCTVNMTGGTINGSEWGILTFGGTIDVSGGSVNGLYGIDVRESTGKLTVSGTAEIFGAVYGINGNGTKNETTDYGNTVIEITGGTVTGNEAAIYHPQSGKLNISGGTLKGVAVATDTGTTSGMGIQMCSGDLTITGSPIITATGANNVASTGGDGLVPDGSAISIVNRNYPGGVPTATISGTPEVTAAAGENAIFAYTWNAQNKTQESWPEAATKVSVSGGSYSTDPGDVEGVSYLAAGFCVGKTADETLYHVAAHVPAAVAAKPATTTADGNAAYWHCANCDTYYSDAGNTVSTADAVKIAKYTVSLPTGLRAPTTATLADVVIDGGTSSVAGVWSWANPTAPVAYGTGSYSVTFTPADTASYTAYTDMVDVEGYEVIASENEGTADTAGSVSMDGQTMLTPEITKEDAVELAREAENIASTLLGESHTGGNAVSNAQAMAAVAATAEKEETIHAEINVSVTDISAENAGEAAEDVAAIGVAVGNSEQIAAYFDIDVELTVSRIDSTGRVKADASGAISKLDTPVSITITLIGVDSTDKVVRIMYVHDGVTKSIVPDKVEVVEDDNGGYNTRVTFKAYEFSTYAAVVSELCSVTFDPQNGAAVTSQKVIVDSKLTKPADPTREGYIFGGWYTDAACTQAYDFDAVVKSGTLTLYAKWTAVQVVEKPTEPVTPAAPVDPVVPAAPAAPPQTGDESNLGLWIGLLIAAVLCFAGVALLGIKRKQSK